MNTDERERQISKRKLRVIAGVILMLYFLWANAQQPSDLDCQGVFASTGAAEQCWAEKLFRTEYKEDKYARFTGKISNDQTTFRFGQDEIEVINTDEELLTIFKEGIFHPEVIFRPVQKSRKKVKIKISNLHEIEIPGTPPGTRRFRFSGFYFNLANPIAYFIELKSESGNNEDLKSFIKNSRLTFYKQGWVMI